MFRLARRCFSSLPSSRQFTITPEIQKALATNGPVVALESTIISHGKHWADHHADIPLLHTYIH